MIHTTRRSLITGLAGLLAAPAIVRASSLMPVKAWIEPRPSEVLVRAASRYLGLAHDGYLLPYMVAPNETIRCGDMVHLDYKDGYVRPGPTATSHVVGLAAADSAPFRGYHLRRSVLG